MRAWQISSNDGIAALQLVEREVGRPGCGEVRVRLKASSLNYRDLSTVKAPMARNLQLPRIPNSDGAGEIVELGEGVDGLVVGDRVASCFFQRWNDGLCSLAAMASALGGAVDGVLAEETILRAEGVIRYPEHLSVEEAATLPCAGLTAWRAVVEEGALRPGDVVLLLGTGGVSIFALQFALLLGARVIITSSSDEKLARAKAMGAWATINYRTTPDWEQAVQDLTDGRGADLTVEVGGAGTLPRSVEATRVAGKIALIGVLTGGEINPAAIMRRSINVQGIYVGSRRMFQDMNRAIEANGLRPVIDRRFAFDDAKAAYHAMESGSHFGKIVVWM